ncbi:MAG TPA: hotdog fold domain-containing protein [Polyangiales bacterium]|nr:hotdog fold domain-containing protein [Polyangiales bacterium]
MDLATMYRQASQLPVLGKRVFSQLVAFQAPYFGSIAPVFERLEPGFVEVSMRNRRAVHNHLGTVHAIAMCNLCEAAAGILIEASLPKSLRWIPRGMTTRYLKKAETDLVARSSMEIPARDFVGDVTLPVQVFDARGQVVMEADITMYVSLQKSAKS